jgi:MSHA biogenesis protein MshJ
MKQLIQFLNSLPLRNGLLLLTIFLGFIFIVWNAALWQPLQTKKDIIATEVKSVTLQIENFQKQITTLKSMRRPKAQSSLNSRVIKIEENSEIIRSIINSKTNLKLIEFQTPAEKVINIPESNPTQANNATQGGISLKQHDIIVKFRGTYFGTINYLQALEKLDIPFFWDKFNYKVIDYPYAEILLQLHTLTY